MSFAFPPTSWPAVIVGFILGIYWLCVLWLVARTKRVAGRAGNFVPPELLGRIIRFAWYPLVVCWIFFPLLTPFVSGLPWAFQPYVYPGAEIVSWVAVMVAVVAFGITCVCWANMGSSWRMGIDPNEKTQLVSSGAYAYVRNPIYGLSQVLVLSTLAVLPTPSMLIITIVHMFFMQWEVRREEKYLLQLHGSPYADYMKRVGRFVPKIGGGH